MPIDETTWLTVEIGDIVRDKKDRLWWIRAAKDGELLLDNGRETRRMERPPADHPVSIYEPTEAEAINLAISDLGGRYLKMIEEREHDIARRLTWLMEPPARTARSIRDHLDMVHAVPVDDVLRRWQGTEVNPSTKQTKAAALAELVEAHDYVHENPDQFPCPFPHVHNLEARS